MVQLPPGRPKYRNILAQNGPGHKSKQANWSHLVRYRLDHSAAAGAKYIALKARFDEIREM